MLPRVILHLAVSVDGRITGAAPGSWLQFELASCWHADALLTDNPTVFKTEARLAPKVEEAFASPVYLDDPRPLLVVPDSHGQLRHWQVPARSPYWRGIIALCSRATPLSHLEYLGKRHIGAIFAGHDQLDMRAALEQLNTQCGVKTVHADGSQVLNGMLLRAGLVDDVRLHVHPYLIVERLEQASLSASEASSPEAVMQLKLSQLERLSGDIIRLRYKVLR